MGWRNVRGLRVDQPWRVVSRVMLGVRRKVATVAMDDVMVLPPDDVAVTVLDDVVVMVNMVATVTTGIVLSDCVLATQRNCDPGNC